MGIEQNPNLDELTRLTLRVIALEALPEKIQNQLDVLTKNFIETSQRVTILEEARQAQRSLNATFLQKGTVIQAKAEIKPIKRFKWF